MNNKKGYVMDKKIVVDEKQKNRVRDGANLIQAVEDLLLQEISVNTQILSLKAAVKKNAALDKFNLSELSDLSKLLSLQIGITAKKAEYKAQLVSMKPEIIDSQYQIDIQDTIDSIGPTV